MTRILVSIDGSEGGERLLPHVAALAAATGASVRLLRVLDPLSDAGHEFDTNLDAAVARVEAQWLAGMKDTLARYALEGEAEVRRLPRRRDVSDVIALAGDETEAAIIAVHSHGSGGLRHMFRGSTALDVVARAGRPVLATGHHASAPPTAKPYRVLATNDGSEAARATLEPLRELFGGTESTVTLLRVLDGNTDEAAARAELREIAAGLEGVNVDVEVRAAGGDGVSKAVLAAANEAGAHAIAMATHGHSALRHVLAGSTALGVLGQAAVPVILVRPF